MEEVAQLKKDILKLKAIAKTVGDSATAYQMVVDLGDAPTSDNIIYSWAVILEPLSNPENAIFIAEPVGGYMFITFGGGENKSVYINRIFPFTDINDPTRFIFNLYYNNPQYVEVHGKNKVSFTSNVPFRVKDTTRTTVQLY